MKNREHNISERTEKQKFKKKYVLRKLEERDAEKRIKDYKGKREGPSVDLEDEYRQG